MFGMIRIPCLKDRTKRKEHGSKACFFLFQLSMIKVCSTYPIQWLNLNFSIFLSIIVQD